MGKRKADVWFPLYVGDYLADTMHLSTEMHGAYLLILMAYWRNEGPIESNDEKLSAITRTDYKKWAKIRPEISKFFDVDVLSGFWVHKRVEKELMAAQKNKRKAANAAAIRWGK